VTKYDNQEKKELVCKYAKKKHRLLPFFDSQLEKKEKEK